MQKGPTGTIRGGACVLVEQWEGENLATGVLSVGRQPHGDRTVRGEQGCRGRDCQGIRVEGLR